MFDFPLSIKNPEEIPEKYRALYEQEGEDGDFTLDGSLHNKITKLVESLEKERKRSKDATKESKSWADLGESPEAVRQQLESLKEAHAAEIEELKTLIDKEGDVKDKFEKLRLELVKSHDEELKAKDAALVEMEETLRKHLVESAAKSAIAEAKGKVKPLLPYVLQTLKLVKEEEEYRVVVLDEDGEPRITKDGKNMDIRSLVEELKADVEFQPLFEATQTTGSGARQSTNTGTPGVSSNPWNPKSRNYTEQMRLERENPPLANRLKAQAASA